MALTFALAVICPLASVLIIAGLIYKIARIQKMQNKKGPGEATVNNGQKGLYGDNGHQQRQANMVYYGGLPQKNEF